jgi:hypothetical protein
MVTKEQVGKKRRRQIRYMFPGERDTYHKRNKDIEKNQECAGTNFKTTTKGCNTII